MHKAMRVILIAVILVCSIPSFSCAAKKACDEQDIRTQFPGYHILDARDLDTMTSDYFQEKFSMLAPGLVKADFDGNGYQDLAVLLRADNVKTTKFVIFLSSASAQCAVAYELDVSLHYDSVYLTPVRAGSALSQTESIDIKTPMSPVKLAHTGIRLTYLGKAEVVLYWDDKLGKIITIQTAG